MGVEPSTPFTPAATLPSQMPGAALADASVHPEKRLMLAVLEDAVATFQRTLHDPGRRAQRLHLEAADWFASTDVSWPYAYRNVCDALGIEAEWLREGLWRWRTLQRALPAGAHPPPRAPFRRVGGSRTRATGRAIGLRGTA